ncbi:hypothetical protein [Roseofilum capinflatum]|uniref:GNAT family N-acetyltransferase n=1 Tax=Roseofilum capinflatum BLCC-M114 TaxID=3022440 RepID=A0ABT7B8X4_9CYAN|nr:hypothetical protein [Roseofilum capinflatum]MDJ1175607.1 hypothetical protein [Roseofilum capinflatum BLCC-M114]
METTTENQDRYLTVAVSPVAVVDRIERDRALAPRYQLFLAPTPSPDVGDRALFVGCVSEA